MATNVAAFNLGLDRFAESQDKRIEDTVKGVGIYALKNLVMGTRVDTGRARGNWQVTHGTPAEGEVERFDEAGREGNFDTLAHGTTAVLAADGKKVLWIHNGVLYISILEELDGMLRGTVEGARTWLRSGGRLG